MCPCRQIVPASREIMNEILTFLSLRLRFYQCRSLPVAVMFPRPACRGSVLKICERCPTFPRFQLPLYKFTRPAFLDHLISCYAVMITRRLLPTI